MGANLLCDGRGSFAFDVSRFGAWFMLTTLAFLQNGDVSYGVGSSDTLVGTFSAQGNLTAIPDSSSPVEGTTKFVRRSVFAVPF